MNFADAVDRDAAIFQDVHQHGTWRLDRVVVAARCAREIPRHACERAGDYAADFVRSIQQLARDFAHFVQLADGNDFFVGGDLKHAVAGSVDNRKSSAHMFFAQLLEYFRSGSRLVADGLSSDALLKFLDDFGGETVWINRKGLVQPDTRHFPMPDRRIFAGRMCGGLSVSGQRVLCGRKIRERSDVG